MKSRFLLIICLFIIDSFTQSNGMSYWEHIKGYFTPKAKQNSERLTNRQDKNIEFSPTMIHLKTYKNESAFFEKDILENLETKQIYVDFIEKERELNQNGYYTFVHSQKRQFYFPQRLYSHLWGLRKKQPIENFLFVHLNDLVDTEEAKFEEDILRKTIHTVGTAQEGMLMDLNRRRKVLFMNYAFFANTMNLGSSSAYFLLSNTSITPSTLTIKEPFKLLGYEWVYKNMRKSLNN